LASNLLKFSFPFGHALELHREDGLAQKGCRILDWQKDADAWKAKGLHGLLVALQQVVFVAIEQHQPNNRSQ
jgi:hypothetical protein